MKIHSILLAQFLLIGVIGISQNKDPQSAELITSDIDNFWKAFDAAGPDFSSEPFQTMYLDKGSKGVKGFTKGRIQDAEYLSKIVKQYANYYAIARASTLRITEMEPQIRRAFVKLKEIYPQAVFPDVYFVIGALNSGGTTSSTGLIIGAEMYGLEDGTSKEGLSNWLQTVLNSIDGVPHIVAHEVIHYQQRYDGKSLLAKAIKEGAADFISELISGNHINQHVHDFANPREQELWTEFKGRMHDNDYNGWLYSSSDDRPNDLGYWMGYKITKAYYDKQADKMKAIDDILHIKNFDKFLKDSEYEERFTK